MPAEPASRHHRKSVMQLQTYIPVFLIFSLRCEARVAVVLTAQSTYPWTGNSYRSNNKLQRVPIAGLEIGA